MVKLQTLDLDRLLMALFQEMRQAEMSLTIEQYNWLRIAVEKGYGLGGWDDLERVCRWLWVRPIPEYAQEKFTRAFERFRQNHELKTEAITQAPPDPQLLVNSLPQVPPRKFPAPQLSFPEAEPVKVPIAVKVDSPPRLSAQGKTNFLLSPRDLPVSLSLVRMLWRSLRRPLRNSQEMELDWEETLSAIQKQGHFSDVVMRPVLARKAELVLLIDDNNAMIPFRPAIEPMVQAIAQRWVMPAKIYRFTSYPDEYLYDWQRPYQAEALAKLFPQWHRDRTIIMIWSDGGAAIGTESLPRIKGIAYFLKQLKFCARQVIWINPLPPHRWQHTSADSINKILNGTMISLSPANFQSLARHQALDPNLQLK